MGIFKKKNKNNLYLSDKQPLTTGGVIALVCAYAFLVIWAIAVILPILQIVISSFNDAQATRIIIGGEIEWGIKNFKILFEETKFFKWMWNTIYVSVSTAILVVIIVSFTGYAYSRYRFKGKRASLLTVMLLQTIPSFAGLTAYFTLHQIVAELLPKINGEPMISRHAMLILIYAGGGIAGNTIILKGYLDSISTELDDAAKIDGCSSMKIYRLIIMPIARPMLAIIALWSFISPFMDFMLPKILLNSEDMYTLAAGLRTLIIDERNMNQPAFAAGALLTAIPIVALFVVLQKELVSGLSSGATKG